MAWSSSCKAWYMHDARSSWWLARPDLYHMAESGMLPLATSSTNDVLRVHHAGANGGGTAHARAHTRTNAHVHTHVHAHKAYNHAKHNYCCPAGQYWDACAPLRCLSLVQANPPRAGLVTHRRTVQVSRREVVEPKVPQ